MKYPTLRSVITGALAIVTVAIWQQQSTQMAGSTDLMGISPPIPAIIFLLLLIAALNPILRRARPPLSFSASEMVTVFTMVIVGLPLCTTGWAQAILPSRIAFRYFATVENNYERDFFAYIKSWVGPADPEVVRGFYEGGAASIPWLAWLPSLLVWGFFTLVFYFTFMCLVILVKDKWIEDERLSFPLLKLPMELIAAREKKEKSILRNKLLWLGCLIPLVLHTVNGLNAYIPGIPAIDIRFDISSKLHNHPWSNMYGVGIFFRPLLIGVGYLMSQEVSFSLWFFFLLQKLMLVVSAAMAWGGSESPMAGFPFAGQQRSGAMIMLGLVYVWMLRKHLGMSFRMAFLGGGASRRSAPTKVEDYRWAWLGFIGGAAAVVYFSTLVGMSLLVGGLFFVIIILYIFVLTKVRAEGGVPCIYVYEPPGDILKMPFGSHALGKNNLAGMALFGYIMQDVRAAMMPNILDGYKLNRENRSLIKGLAVVVLLAIIIGMICGIWTEFELCYKYGANSLGSWRRDESHRWFKQLSTLIQNPTKVKSQVPLAFVGVGAGITVLLSFLRTRFIWWPFHPIGYALGSILWVEWSCIFFGWLSRLVIHRLGGTKGYRRFLPFFLGLIMGDFIMHGFWGLMGSVIKGKGYLAGW